MGSPEPPAVSTLEMAAVAVAAQAIGGAGSTGTRIFKRRTTAAQGGQG